LSKTKDRLLGDSSPRWRPLRKCSPKRS